MHLDHSCGTKVISVGIKKGLVKGPGRATGGPSPGTREVNRVKQQKDAPASGDVSPLQPAH